MAKEPEELTEDQLIKKDYVLSTHEVMRKLDIHFVEFLYKMIDDERVYPEPYQYSNRRWVFHKNTKILPTKKQLEMEEKRRQEEMEKQKKEEIYFSYKKKGFLDNKEILVHLKKQGRPMSKQRLHQLIRENRVSPNPLLTFGKRQPLYHPNTVITGDGKPGRPAKHYSQKIKEKV